ncbi:MAG: TSUP family transporter [Paracoccaceae bacterium]
MSDALGIGAPWALAAMLATYFMGGIVKGGLGFGLPLVTLSLMPLFLPADLAIAVNAIVLPFINVVQIAQAGGPALALRRFWPLILTLVATMPLGVALGRGIAPEALTLALGLAVVAFTTFQWASPRLALPARLERPLGALTGAGAGVVGGLVGINGPFFLIYLVGLQVERQMLMAALGVFFFLTGVVLTASFWVAGVIDAPRAGAALACLIPAMVGQALGNRLSRRLPVEAFRAVVLGGLMIVGLNITVRAALAL